jgi:Tol biopolymer transport system component
MLRRVGPAFAAGSLVLVALVTALAMAPVATASYPGRNGLIAMGRDLEDGNRPILTMRPNGHSLTQITHVDGEHGLLAWSPNGRQITFTLNGCSIGFVDADGSNYHVLPPEDPDTVPGENVCDGDSDYLPDGQHVVYDHYDAITDTETLRTMKLDGSDRRVLFEGCCDPSVSPDGTKISFHPGEGPLAVANLDGSGYRQLSPDWNVGIKSDWAPDGSRIVFWNNRIPEPEDLTNVYSVKPDGSDLTQITHFTSPAYRVSGTGYSPDGRWIMFKLERTDLGRHAFYRMRPDGKALKRISDWFDWAPRQIDWGAVPAH